MGSGPPWWAIAAIVVLSAPGWIPIVWALGWWGAGVLAFFGVLGILTLAHAIAFGRWIPW